MPTPLRDGAPDLSFVEAAGATRSRASCGPARSSCSSRRRTRAPPRSSCARSSRSPGCTAGRDFFLGYSPERIDPGNPHWTFENTPKVVSGSTTPSLRAVEAFYGALVDKVVPVGSTAEAELVKLLENTFRHVNIALVNELAMFAGDLGVDIWSAIDAASHQAVRLHALHARARRRRPLPADRPVVPLVAGAAQRRVRRFRFVELANDVNEHMPDYVVRRITDLLNSEAKAVQGTRILLLGLAYKAATSDWRESPSIAVAERLATLGADLRCCDPHVGPQADFGYPMVALTDAELEAADLVVLLVNHPDFPLDRVAARSRLVLDTKGELRGRVFKGETL